MEVLEDSLDLTRSHARKNNSNNDGHFPRYFKYVELEYMKHPAKIKLVYPVAAEIYFLSGNIAIGLIPRRTAQRVIKEKVL